jgi:uncharacterized repeat protein (TIGR03803 family)
MRWNSFAAFALVCGVAWVAGAAPAEATSYRVVYSFKPKRGDAPWASLIKVGGRLFGTTTGGGTHNNGTVFSVQPAFGGQKVVYSFESSSTDGAVPYANLIDVGGTLFGTTGAGGIDACGNFSDQACGTVFSVNPTTGAEQVVYFFKGGTDSNFPAAGLIDVAGTLYGTAAQGGAHGQGTVFSVNPTTGTEDILYSFQGGSDAANPTASLLNVGGTLYGVATNGGAYGLGAAFSVNATTGAETVLHSFGKGKDGQYPGSLIQLGGKLYGLTEQGGRSANCYGGCGTVFSFNLSTGIERVVYSFQAGTNGALPSAGLVNVAGTLYGTTYYGGPGNCPDGFVAGCGTVFSFNPKTDAEQILYAFQGGTDGANPQDNLLDSDGTLYGTTENGGPGNCKSNYSTGCGTVFALTP